MQDLVQHLQGVHVVFPAMVGPQGLGGQLQTALEQAGIPCVGAAAAALPLSSHKAKCAPAQQAVLPATAKGCAQRPCPRDQHARYAFEV